MKIVKLKYENEKIQAMFDTPLDFVEGANSAMYPTTIAAVPWRQFTPNEFEKEIENVLEEAVCLWNEKERNGQTGGIWED